MKFVGLKGYSRYGDEKALSLEEINEIAKEEEIFVALNRVKEADEICEVAKKLSVSGFIVNEIAAIKELKCRKVVASVGLTPMNRLDVEFLRDLGAFAVVIPPELNEEVEGLKVDGVKIEAFKKAFVEMFYKGKCLLSAYFSGVSVKRDGVCKKECCRKWNVEFEGKSLEVSFAPKFKEFDVSADFLKHEGRQFSKVGVIEYGTHDQRSES